MRSYCIELMQALSRPSACLLSQCDEALVDERAESEMQAVIDLVSRVRIFELR